jgi:hypothetical protein
VSFGEAFRGFDWVGAALIVCGLPMALVGMLLTIQYPSSDVRVIATLTIGLILIAIFGFWESMCESRFGVRFALCPRHIFTRGKGRDFTAPCLAQTVGFQAPFSMNLSGDLRVTDYIHGIFRSQHRLANYGVRKAEAISFCSVSADS